MTTIPIWRSWYSIQGKTISLSDECWSKLHNLLERHKLFGAVFITPDLHKELDKIHEKINLKDYDLEVVYEKPYLIADIKTDKNLIALPSLDTTFDQLEMVKSLDHIIIHDFIDMSGFLIFNEDYLKAFIQ